MTMSEISMGVVRSLENVWKEKQLIDFIVKINDVSIDCHRLILGACSDFFQALFRSGMREVTENCVVLQGISCRVFRLILKSLYTGVDILTSKNVLEVWRAVNQLQISFMVKVCETFVIKTLSAETWQDTYTNAKLLDSADVLEELYSFMLKNFDRVCLDKTFLDLSYSEIHELVKSQDLIVSSEDLVLEAVVKWVEFVPQLDQDYTMAGVNSNINSKKVNKSTTPGSEVKRKERKQKKIIENSGKDQEELSKISRNENLTQLLTAVRTCIVSPATLKRVFKYKIFSENNDAKAVIFDALSYHVLDFRHGQWPSSAVHRSNSEYSHFGVCATNAGEFQLMCLSTRQWQSIADCAFLKLEIQLVAFDNNLYAIGKEDNRQNGTCKMFVFCGDVWEEVMTMPNPNHALMMFSQGHYIYILDKTDKKIYNFKPQMMSRKMETFADLPGEADIQHAMFYSNSLLLFCSETHNGIDETSVFMLDISSNVWTRLDTLDGPAEQLINFTINDNVYILQTNGSLWRLNFLYSYQKIKFTFIAKLWNFEKKLYGAVTYNGELIIFGNNPAEDPPDEHQLSVVTDVLLNISHLGMDELGSNLIPITLSKKFLLPIT
ncbi:kelch-like protein 41 [Physella acuta]|uniref:kelch-like protein 41 n=1 Tax=Physella acuta TaxID=109671 RepID=UPI0027DCA9F6|nr:kelch-like protein 41 [Physella acuta]